MDLTEQEFQNNYLNPFLDKERFMPGKHFKGFQKGNHFEGR